MRKKLPLRHVALNLLARREHSQKELLQKLLLREFNCDEIKKTIADLVLEGLQSDERFAESYITARINRGFGSRRIKMELQERGISTEIIERCLNHESSYWNELAEKVRRKKFGAAVPKDFTARAKQANYLSYKGF